MEERANDERKVYLYELNDKRFKEIKGSLKISAGKAVIVREDNGKAVSVATEEAKVFKNNYVWLEKRNKLRAAEVFKYKIDKDISKELENIKNLELLCDILDKYFDVRK